MYIFLTDKILSFLFAGLFLPDFYNIAGLYNLYKDVPVTVCWLLTMVQ